MPLQFGNSVPAIRIQSGRSLIRIVLCRSPCVLTCAANVMESSRRCGAWPLMTTPWHYSTGMITWSRSINRRACWYIAAPSTAAKPALRWHCCGISWGNGFILCTGSTSRRPGYCYSRWTVATAVSQQFEAGEVHKSYLAVVRGHPPLGGIIRQPLTVMDDTRSRAQRSGRPDAGSTDPFSPPCHLGTACPGGPALSAQSLCPALAPSRTGRRHQLRRHMKHISHPIIGDSSYGKGPYNRFFESIWRTPPFPGGYRPQPKAPCQRRAPAHYQASRRKTSMSVIRQLGWQEPISHRANRYRHLADLRQNTS